MWSCARITAASSCLVLPKTSAANTLWLLASSICVQLTRAQAPLTDLADE
jgi:hypothetical protein